MKLYEIRVFEKKNYLLWLKRSNGPGQDVKVYPSGVRLDNQKFQV